MPYKEKQNTGLQVVPGSHEKRLRFPVEDNKAAQVIIIYGKNRRTVYITPSHTLPEMRIIRYTPTRTTATQARRAYQREQERLFYEKMRVESLPRNSYGYGRERKTGRIPIEPGAEFQTPSQERFVRNLLRASRLPTMAVKTLGYRPNPWNKPNLLGRAWETGELELFKRMDSIPAIAQLGTVVHELTHINTPFKPENTRLYGSEQKRIAAAYNAIKIARQSEKTKKFMNPYHEFLHGEMQRGEISYFHWVEENSAIVNELTVTNPNHLKQVQDAQHARLRRIEQLTGRKQERVNLVSERRADGTWNVSGADRALMALTGIQSVTALHNHWRQIRNSLQDTVTPLHSPILKDPVSYIRRPLTPTRQPTPMMPRMNGGRRAA